MSAQKKGWKRVIALVPFCHGPRANTMHLGTRLLQNVIVFWQLQVMLG